MQRLSCFLHSRNLKRDKKGLWQIVSRDTLLLDLKKWEMDIKMCTKWTQTETGRLGQRQEEKPDGGGSMGFLGYREQGHVHTHNLLIPRNLQETFPFGPTISSAKIRSKCDNGVPFRDYIQTIYRKEIIKNSFPISSEFFSFEFPSQLSRSSMTSDHAGTYTMYNSYHHPLYVLSDSTDTLTSR